MTGYDPARPAWKAGMLPITSHPRISRSTYYLISNQIVNSRAGHQEGDIPRTAHAPCCGIWAAERPVRKEDQCMNMIVTGIPPRECRAGGYRRDDLSGSTTGDGGGLGRLSYHCLHHITTQWTKSANFQIRCILFAMISITLAFQRRAVRWLIGTLSMTPQKVYRPSKYSIRTNLCRCAPSGIRPSSSIISSTARRRAASLSVLCVDGFRLISGYDRSTSRMYAS